MPDATTFKILSIDPGTTHTGYALLTVDHSQMKIVAAKAWTVHADKCITDEDWDVHLYNERFARVKQHGAIFYHYLKKYQPVSVVCESPFYNPKRPNAYGALLEIVLTIRAALYRFDKWLYLHQIDPSTAKKNIGVPGNSNDKSLIKQSLLQHPDFKNANLQDFDEHAADALAIGYCHLQRLNNATSL